MLCSFGFAAARMRARTHKPICTHEGAAAAVMMTSSSSSVKGCVSFVGFGGFVSFIHHPMQALRECCF